MVASKGLVACLVLFFTARFGRAQAPASGPEALAAYNKLHKAFYDNYKEDLPSCDERFYTLTQASREVARACKNANPPIDKGCSAECNAYIELYGAECEREEVLLEASLSSAVLAKVEAGTQLDEKEAKVFEAAFQRAALESGMEVPEDGFLSTAAKQKAFFGKSENLEGLKEAEAEAKEEASVVPDYITTCLKTTTPASGPEAPAAPSDASSSGFVSGSIATISAVLMVWHAHA
eukprot:jgi/Picre1/31097/NNA_006452.t1